MAKNLLLAGYFGAGNLGDDAILLGFVQGLGKTEYSITVMSGAPEETFRNYGLRAIGRRDMDAYKRELESCDAVVFPGGSIFQDSSSFKSVAFYANLVKLAKAKKKRVIMLGQGIGPLDTFFGKRFACAALNEADIIAVRDPASVATLQGIGVKRPIRVTADMALLLPPPPDVGTGMEFGVGNMKTVGISVRPFGKGKDTVDLFSELTKMLFRSNYMPVLIEMDREHDGPLILEISKAQGGKVPDLRKLATPMQVQSRIARMDAVIAMRLHAGVLAATVGVPPLMVSYDPKVSAFAKLLDVGSALPFQGLTPARIFDAFTAMQRDRARNEKVLQRKVADLQKLAGTNITLLEEALGGVPADRLIQ